jgi:hypothetical protein
MCHIYVVCITSSKGWTMHVWLCHVDGGSITRFGSYMLSGRSNKNLEPHDQSYDGIERLPWWQHDISHDTSPHYSVDLTCTITRRLYVCIIIHESSTIHREHGRIMHVYNKYLYHFHTAQDLYDPSHNFNFLQRLVSVFWIYVNTKFIERTQNTKWQVNHLIFSNFFLENMRSRLGTGIFLGN